MLPGADVDRWDVEIRIDGRPGQTTITEEVLGPRALHGGGLLQADGPAPSGWWLAAAGLALLTLPLAGFSRWWRPAMWTGGSVLLATCATASWEVWTRSNAVPAQKAGLIPVGILGVLLAVGLILSARRDDARGLVFAGSAGLAVLIGWVNRAALITSADSSVLFPVVAQAAAALALGLGGGLALLMVVLSRGQVQALVASFTRRPSVGEVDPKR